MADMAAMVVEAHEAVWAEVQRGMQLAGHQTANIWQETQAFIHAVNWQERWLQALILAHAVTACTVLLCRRSTGALSSIFCALGCAVYFGERINATAAKHWRSFAGQNYFDERGVFYSALVAGPALLNLLLVLVLYLVQVCALMVQTKRRQLIQKARAASRALSQQDQAHGDKKVK